MEGTSGEKRLSPFGEEEEHNKRRQWPNDDAPPAVPARDTTNSAEMGRGEKRKKKKVMKREEGGERSQRAIENAVPWKSQSLMGSGIERYPQYGALSMFVCVRMWIHT